jgi:trk system potassium uptake protein TrkH
MNKLFNIKIVLRVLGSLLLLESVFLVLVCILPLIYGENDAFFFFVSSAICATFGIMFLWIGRNPSPLIGKREGSVIVTFIWILFSVFGLLPYWLSGSIPNFTDAFFETISGFTTTGASILNNIEDLSHGILFWRSLTQWIGGLGIIVISLAILPVFGVAGTQLFSSESSGPTKDKIHPKINETAKRLFVIYIILTTAETILLRFGGMNWFDAVCHSFSTIATGGFSTKQASIGYWDSAYIQYVISLFMILSGINFSLYYFGVKKQMG